MKRWHREEMNVVRRQFMAPGSLLLASFPDGPALSQEARTPMVRIAEAA
jgi:hypothetical protein